MRKLALGVLLLAFTGTVAGVTYDTVLYTDDPTADLQMYGEVWPEYQADSVEIVLTYTFGLENEAFNATKITGFDVLVLNASGTVLTHDVSVPSLDITNGPVEGYTEFSAPVPPEQVTELEFRVNHSAILPDGTTAERRLEGGIDPELRPPNRTLDGFRTNATEVYRDQQIWVMGNASNLRSITIGNRSLEIDVARFGGRVPLPDGLATGRQEVRFRITSPSDYIFRRNLTLEILNRPPRLNLSVPEQVSQGGTVEVGFEVIDDTGIGRYEATLVNETYTSNTSTLAVPTEGLTTGLYNITGTVTDLDGARTTDSALFSIAASGGNGNGNGDGGDGSDGGGGDDGGDGETDQPSRFPLIGPFRDFVTNLIRSLIG